MKALLLAVCVLVVAADTPAAERQMIGAEQDHSQAAAGDCEHFYKTTFTSFGEQIHDQEQREISLEGIEQIRVTAAQEGGLSIRGWNKPHARLVVCRYAVANTRQHAMRLMSRIGVSSANGEIIARGPKIDATQAWWVNMILYLPRNANAEVQAANGAVAIRNMSGRITAKSTSGGISIAQSSGRYKVTTESGGITLDRITGSVDAASRDGAIALKVAGAETPSVEAKTADAGHILCTLKSCESSAMTANRTTLRLGEGVPDFRLATTGASIFIGPVTY
jgi:DUF4097 and DUF4098 domain-containing protein YvlB